MIVICLIEPRGPYRVIISDLDVGVARLSVDNLAMRTTPIETSRPHVSVLDRRGSTSRFSSSCSVNLGREDVHRQSRADARWSRGSRAR